MERVSFLMLALFGGFIGSLMSGGSLVTLFILNLLEIPTKVAIGTLKMVIALLTLISSMTYFRAGVLKNLKLVNTLTLFSLVGAYLGSSFLLSISDRAAKILVLVLLLIGTYFALKEQKPTLVLKGNLWQALIGLIIGVYVGILGIASTLIIISAISLFLHMDILESNATAKVIIFVNNFVAFLNYASQDSVNYSLGILLGVPVIIGSWLGAKVAVKIGSKKLKVIFLIMALLTAFRILEELLTL
ncbi:sulfite exporter TauE/SafE family protein [Thermococcus sp.]|uniref:sulfite exporter TauE/SafE family protein n=1 Tax=Thermococcus sp. TaxID=35749 RepID=UPI0026094346|nr:sulfite exporter TauE/SafE family protein [Thermococcus sp.]MCD6143806.1 sulfite exporter TauE/SafE family protein [Thermococcus sp.]